MGGGGNKAQRMPDKSTGEEKELFSSSQDQGGMLYDGAGQQIMCF